MAKAAKKELKIDLRPAIESLGLKQVLEQVGIDRFIEAVGAEQIIERSLPSLTPEQRRALKQKLS